MREMTKTQDRNDYFGKRLKSLRESFSLSQTDLGKELGIPPQYAPNVISSWENQKREPNFNTLVKIASFFGVSTDYLLGLDRHSDPPDDVLLLRSQNLSTTERQLLIKIIDAFKDIDFEAE